MAAIPVLSDVQATTAQVIHLGASQDLAYNAAGGASVRAGPFAAQVLRLALWVAGTVRISIGDGTVAATSSSTVIVGIGVEFIGIKSGQYLAAISNDATTGSLNITQAG